MSEGKAKFTPGPWVVKQSEWGISVQCEKSPSGLPFAVTPVCEIEQEPDTGGLEDAALIAAAPDMYAALENALKVAEFEGHPFRPWQEEARAALAKARGEAV
jgi:hypothetical protein